jgi:hypothetical protein
MLAECYNAERTPEDTPSERREVMLSKIVTLIVALMSFLIFFGDLVAGEALPAQRPFPSVLLEPVPDPGLEMHSIPPLAPLDFTGALDILVNQDNTLQLQNEQQIVTNPTDPDNIVAVWRDFRLGYRRVAFGASFDGGITWTENLFEEPTYPWHSDPGLTVDALGNFFAVILLFHLHLRAEWPVRLQVVRRGALLG